MNFYELLLLAFIWFEILNLKSRPQTFTAMKILLFPKHEKKQFVENIPSGKDLFHSFQTE